uniref:Putative secreted peptide n=1 Tax=Anopheles braziliensis TaxID=58242 RepID=A0A2M3ZWZ8_9DIPT
MISTATGVCACVCVGGRAHAYPFCKKRVEYTHSFCQIKPSKIDCTGWFNHSTNEKKLPTHQKTGTTVATGSRTRDPSSFERTTADQYTILIIRSH